MRKFFEFLVYTNIWISLGASSLCFLYYAITQQTVQLNVLAFVFFATISTYTYQRISKLLTENIDAPRINWMKKRKVFSVSLLVAGLIGTGLLAFTLEWKSWFLLLALGVISMLYTFKTKWFNASLRDIPGVKIFLIAMVWTGSSCLLPAIETGNYESLPLICAGFGLLVLSITIPFDIRDIDLDEENKQTIPQVFGVFGAKILSLALLSGSFLLFYLLQIIGAGMIIGFILTAILIGQAKKDNDELFFSLILDGTLNLVPALHWLLP